MTETATHETAYPASLSPGPWQYFGRIGLGGTLVDLAAGLEGRLWAASPAGLFRETEEGWRPVVEGIPFARLSAIYARERMLIAAGMPAGIARSVDDGRSWNMAWAEQARMPVTCIAASPNISQDGILLAGTDGDGVLRSTDSGRSWELSNFGLRSFAVLSLATAPRWEASRQVREIVFAGTDHGVYESPNGGRAWRERRAGMPDDAVLSLAVSPGFGEDRRVWAGTEQSGLFRSEDGGCSWEAVEFGVDDFGPVNSILDLGSGLLLAGTGRAGVLFSADRGATWEQSEEDASVLSLCVSGSRFYAGLSERGLLVSEDRGRSWAPVPDLAARRFTILRSFGGGWIAAGPQEGVWRSVDGHRWQDLWASPEGRPVVDLAAGAGYLLSAAPEGVWRIEPAGVKPLVVLNAPVSRLAAWGEQAWAGTQDGRLFVSGDGGENWSLEQVPFGGQAVAALDAAGGEGGLWVVTALPRRREITLWRRAGDGGGWKMVVNERTDWFTVRFAAQDDGRFTLGFGVTLLSNTSGGLRRSEITRPEAPVSAVSAAPGSDLRLASAGERVFASLDGESWDPFDEGLDSAPVTAFSWQAGSGGRFILALTSDGRIYRRAFNG